jgi:Competence protein CoiA-like family
MLTALSNDVRVYATAAEKGPEYVCPGCRAALVLRKGRVRIHHFAHYPPVICSWGIGETLSHLEAKLALKEALQPRCHRAELEWPVASLSGDRRADVFVWEMAGGQIAFELQHTPISIDEIERRTRAYMSSGLAVAWLPFLTSRFRVLARRARPGEPGDWLVERYRPKPFERWLSAFNFGEIWYWAPKTKRLLRGTLEPDLAMVPTPVWHQAFGEAPLVTASSASPFMRLRLDGPYDPATLSIRVSRRKPASVGRFELPGGPIARLTPQGSHLRWITSRATRAKPLNSG